MGSEEQLKEIVAGVEEFANLEKVKMEEKAGELDREFKTTVRKFKNDFDEEVDALKKRAKESLDHIRSNFVATALGLIALLFIAIAIAIYPSFKDVNSLQKDIMAARTTADAEKEKLTVEIKALDEQLKLLRDANQTAVNQLSATQASYQNRIQELEALDKKLRQPTK